MKEKIVVFGAGGRIGLPLSAWFAEKGAKVVGIELDDDYVDRLNTGLHVPFAEKGLKEALQHTVIKTNRLRFISYKSSKELWDCIKDATMIVVCVGTPLNEDTGEMDQTALLQIFDILMNAPEDTYMATKLIALRSTVPVGTTDELYARWFVKTGKKPNLVFWPERVLEGNALEEFSTIPSIFGFPEGSVVTNSVYQSLYKFNVDVILTTAKEAEFIKASSNMVRYVEFALANELMMLADSYGIEYNKLHRIMKQKYPRLDSLKAPGINVGGPCLSKDWAALNPSLLIRDAHSVNSELINLWVAKKLTEKKVSRVLILGASFKPDSDDERGSGLEALTDILEDKGLIWYAYDPHIPDYNKLPLNGDLKYFDAFVVFTPHNVFEDGIYNNIMKHADKNAWFFNYWRAYGAFENERSVFQIKDANYNKLIPVDWSTGYSIEEGPYIA